MEEHDEYLLIHAEHVQHQDVNIQCVCREFTKQCFSYEDLHVNTLYVKFLCFTLRHCSLSIN